MASINAFDVGETAEFIPDGQLGTSSESHVSEPSVQDVAESRVQSVSPRNFQDRCLPVERVPIDVPRG